MKYLKFFLIYAVLATLIFIIYSCSCSNCSKQEETVVPIDVLKKANAFIISKTGEEFFDNYIAPDFVRTKYTPPYYNMTYNLRMPEKPYVNNKITFTVDSVGNIVKERDIIGIPNCNAHPSQCNWNLDMEAAIDVATKYGLEKGVKDWQVDFIWNPERQIYVWHIVTVLREIEGDYGYRGIGKDMVIDPVTGDILTVNDWHTR